MAIGWLVAFKAVPWTQVIEATPMIVRGARAVWQSARRTNEEVDRELAEGHRAEDADLAARVELLERELAGSDQRQAALAELVSSLAEQNAALVEAVGILKTRTRLLLALNLVLLAAVGVVAWAALSA